MNLESDKAREPAGPLNLKPWNTIFRDKDHGWSPLLWVLYLGFFFVQPIYDHVSLRMWLLDGLGAVIFLFLYFGLFILVHPRSLVHIAGMMLLGLLYQPFNGGACTFFIFSAAMLPFCVESQPASFHRLLVTCSPRAIQAFVLALARRPLFCSALF